MIALVVYALALAELDLAIAWDYKANGGDWSGYGVCGQPGQQSPIDLPASAPTAEEDLTMFLKYPELKSDVTVYNNGNSIALTMPEDFRAGFGLGKGSDKPKAFESEDADAYRLWQVNFHSPSEHTINGERLPLEMQMMHQQVTGGEGLAVVVVLFNNAANEYGALLDSIIGDGLPRKKLAEASRKTPFEFASVLSGSEFYTYEGSLTVPPCEHEVKYFVRKDPVSAAHAQLEAFRKVLKETCAPNGNYRSTQTLSSTVQLVGSVDSIKAPDKVVRPGKARLPVEKAALSGVIDPRCNPEDLKKNLGRIAVGDSKAVRVAKTNLNVAVTNTAVASGMVTSGARKVADLQKLYAAAPGLVEKIRLKGQVVAAEQQLAANEKHVPLTNSTRAKVLQVTMDVVVGQCIAQHRAAVAKAKAPLNMPAVTGTSPAWEIAKRYLGGAGNTPHSGKQKATRHFKYPEPHVRLPSGLGGSPFSNKPPDAAKVIMSDKISANLRQPDAPQIDGTLEAHTKDNMATGEGNTEKILVVRLPVDYATGGASAFKGDLVKAMAKTLHVSENRLEIKETRKVEVQRVHVSKPLAAVTEAPGPYAGPLTQKLSSIHSNTTVLLSRSKGVDGHDKEVVLPRRALRHGHLRSR